MFPAGMFPEVQTVGCLPGDSSLYAGVATYVMPIRQSLVSDRVARLDAARDNATWLRELGVKKTLYPSRSTIEMELLPEK